MKVGIIGMGYVARKHLDACKSVGADVVAICDPHDNVGIIDGYYPKAKFYRNITYFFENVERLDITHIVVATPNILHKEHTRFALAHGCDVILEKPAVLRSKDIRVLVDAEIASGKRVHTVLQLRQSPTLKRLKTNIALKEITNYKANLTYRTYRGHWYENSWKSNPSISGGLLFNIGIHLFDAIGWAFGEIIETELRYEDKMGAAGTFYLADGSINWRLSTEGNQTRNLSIHHGDNLYTEIDFTNDINLHNEFYKTIVDGTSTGLADTINSILLIEDTRATL